MYGFARNHTRRHWERPHSSFPTAFFEGEYYLRMPRIITVTLNPAIDEAVALEAFVLGGKNRCLLDSLDPGGKGVNASRVIRRLGRETLALGFAGGLTGELLRDNLDDEGVPNAFIGVSESTRVNIMIYERSSARRSRLYLPGPHVNEAALRELERLLLEAARGSVVVLGGSVPPGVPATIYRDFVRALNARQINCIVDTSGEALNTVLRAHPVLVKPNLEEASELLQRELLDDEDVLAAACEIRALGAQQVVISQGARGSVGVNQSAAWKASPPAIAACSTVGSGDSMVAGLAIAMDEGRSLAEGMRLGSAAGAATAMISGTHLCLAKDVYALLDRIEVRELRSAQVSGLSCVRIRSISCSRKRSSLSAISDLTSSGTAGSSSARRSSSVRNDSRSFCSGSFSGVRMWPNLLR